MTANYEMEREMNWKEKYAIPLLCNLIYFITYKIYRSLQMIYIYILCYWNMYI